MQRISLIGLFLVLLPEASAALKVETAQANLRNGPTVGHAVISVAQAGEALRTLAFQDGYAQVERGNGKRGWIHAASQGWSEAEIRSAVATPATPARPQQAPQTRTLAPANPPANSVIPPAPANPVEPLAKPGFTMTLADLGFRQGHYFEGAYGIHAKEFFFPLPRGGKLTSGSIRVFFRAAVLLGEASTLRFDINGKPVRLLTLANRESPAYVDIPLDAQALTQNGVRLTAKAALIHGNDRCFDERKLALFYVQILPQTGLTTTSSAPDNLASAWTALPATTRIGMPQHLTGINAATLLQTAVWLRQMSRHVQFVPYPQPAEIMVGSAAELSGRYPGVLPAGSVAEGGMGLARDAQGRQFILLSDQPAAQHLAPQPLNWAGLLRSDALRFGEASPLRSGANTLDLIAAGLGDTQFVSRTVDWNLDLAAPVIPADARLDQLVLNMVASPLNRQGQLFLQIYLNNMLQEVRPLEQDGKPHTLRFNLESSAQRAGINHLRIAVQRAEEQGNCHGVLAAYPVQILPGSRIELGKNDREPVIFNDLRAHFANGLDIYLTPDGVRNLPREFNQLAALLANLGLAVNHTRVHLLRADETFAPNRPFILAGGGIALKQAAVQFNQGRVRVLDGENQPLLDLDRLPATGIAQIVKQGGMHGLWTQAAREGGLPPIEKLHLDQDNVAFINDQGIALTLDSRQPAVSRVDYPDYSGWTGWLGAHRFWLIALGWMLIAAAAVTMYRKVRQHDSR